jgi:hypothetical protein
MPASTTTARHQVSVLFGPQRNDVDVVLAKISTTLVEDSSLQFIQGILQELPSLWVDITKAWPSLCRVPGDDQIIALLQQLQGSPSATTAEPMNVIMTPLTVITHILDFVKLKGSIGEQNVIDAQGFCVGFLAAIVVACSKSEDEFQSLTATIVRIAVCIGALVDLDELVHGTFRSIAVRWKDLAGCKVFQQVLASHSKVNKPSPPPTFQYFTSATSLTVSFRPMRHASWTPIV